MNILIITRYYPPMIGGISYGLKCLVDTLKKNNHKIIVFVNNHILNKNKSLDKNIFWYGNFEKYLYNNFFQTVKDIFIFIMQIYKESYPIKNKIKISLEFIKTIKSLIHLMNFYEIIKHFEKKYNYDLILSYDSSFSSHIGYLLKKKKKKKLIIVSHGNDVLKYNKNVITQMVLRTADKIIVRSAFIKKLIRNLFNLDKNKINIIPDGVIIDDHKVEKEKFDLRDELNLTKNGFYILTVGLLSLRRKGYDLVLKSLKELRDIHKIDISNIKYILIGRENQKVRIWLNNLAEKYKLNNNFEILVNLDDELRNKYYKASDIFVMPSRDLRNKGSIEGFGRVFIEAGYYYLPSIGSNTGGIPDAIEDGKSGFLVNNFNELVEKIRILYIDKDLRQNLGNYAHNRVLNFFTWQKIYKLFLKTFKN